MRKDPLALNKIRVTKFLLESSFYLWHKDDRPTSEVPSHFLLYSLQQSLSKYLFLGSNVLLIAKTRCRLC